MCDILVAEDKIEWIAKAGEIGLSYDRLRRLDAGGKKLSPGFVDIHVHVTGGGGEQGFASRVPESRMEDIAATGVTTVLGLLGTDGVSRSLENLYAKTCALNEEGISAYMLTGSYSLPSCTMTGDVTRDIALIGPCIGLKLAMSDHRSSHPDGRMLIDAAAQARMGGLISGKKGLVTIHMGSGKAGLSPLFQLLEQSEVPVTNLLPTHMGRTDELFAQGIQLIKMGGNIDLTGSENGSATKRIAQALDKGADPAHLTISSDGYGSQPLFDAYGNCVGLTWSGTGVLHTELCHLLSAGIPLPTALSFITANAADRLGLQDKKGRVREGFDADFVLFDDDMGIYGVVGKGEPLFWEHRTVKTGHFG